MFGGYGVLDMNGCGKVKIGLFLILLVGMVGILGFCEVGCEGGLDVGGRGCCWWK